MRSNIYMSLKRINFFLEENSIFFLIFNIYIILKKVMAVILLINSTFILKNVNLKNL